MAQAAFPLTPGKYYIDGVRIIVLKDKILVDTEYARSTGNAGHEQNVEPAKPKKSFRETATDIAKALDGMNRAIQGK